MGKIELNTQEVIKANFILDNAVSHLNSIYNELSGFTYLLDAAIKGRANIGIRIRKGTEELKSISNKLNIIAITISEGVNKYSIGEDELLALARHIFALMEKDSTEVGISLREQFRGNFDQKAIENHKLYNVSKYAYDFHKYDLTDNYFEKNRNTFIGESSSYRLEIDDLFLKCCGQFGTVGNTISAWGRLVTEGVNGKTILGVAKSSIANYGTYAQTAFETQDISIKSTMLGIGKNVSENIKLDQEIYKKASMGYRLKDSAQAYLKNDIKKYAFSENNTLGKNLSVMAKWAGVVVSLGKNAIDNRAEYERGDISLERSYLETVSETVVELGLGTFSSAIVNSAIIAAGFSSTPVVVAGVATVGVVWAANAITEYLTSIHGEKKSFKEFISDGILDISEVILSKVNDTVDNISIKEIVEVVPSVVINWAK